MERFCERSVVERFGDVLGGKGELSSPDYLVVGVGVGEVGEVGAV